MEHCRGFDGRTPSIGNVVRNFDGELGVVIDCWPATGKAGVRVRWQPLEDGRVTTHEPPDDLGILLVAGEA